MPFSQTAAVQNSVVAMPRQEGAALGLDDLLNYNPLVPREELKKIDPYFNDRDFLMALEITNKIQITKQLKYRNYEEGPWFRPVTPLAITGTTGTGTSTGVTVTMTLTTGSYSPRKTGASSNVMRTSLMKNDNIRTYNGLYAFVANKTGTGTTTVFTIGRAEGNIADLAAALTYHATNSIPLTVFSNGFSEGSLQPLEGLERDALYHENNVQIIKTHRAATGDVDAVDVVTRDGVQRYADKQEFEMGWEHRVKEKMALWWGQGEVYLDATETIPQVKMTKGVDGSIREMGNLYNYSVSTGFLEADFDAIVSQIYAVSGGNEYMIYAGDILYDYLQKIFNLKAKNQPAGVYTFNSFGPGTDAKTKAIEIGFDTFTVKGATFHLIRGDMFNLDGMTNIAGYNYRYMGYLIPGDSQNVPGKFIQNGKETTKVSVPSMSALYTTTRKGDMRRYKYWERPIEITNRDQTDREMLTQVGARLTNVRKFFVIDGV